jgi:hypothetical protein
LSVNGLHLPLRSDSSRRSTVTKAARRSCNAPQSPSST